MNAVKTDNPLEKQIHEVRTKVSALERTVQGFFSTYAGMPAKERAQALTKIQQSLGQIQRFFETFQIALVTNAGARFTYDNAKGAFQTLQGRWRKFESQL